MVASNWVNLEGQVVGQKYRLAKLIEPRSQEAWFQSETSGASPSGAPGEDGTLVVIVSTRPESAGVRPEQLQHPNLRHILASGSDTVQGLSIRYTILENVGETLADILRHGPLDEHTASALALDIVSALNHLHRRGYVYAGLRPSTVARTSRGWVLSDFELLRREATVDPAETRLMLAASPHVPPDAYGGFVSPAWDLWSLGVLLNQAVTAVPRPGRRNKPTPAPPPFDSIIRGCLDPNPDERIGLRDVAALLGADLHSRSEHPAGQDAQLAPAGVRTEQTPGPARNHNGTEAVHETPERIAAPLPLAARPERRRSRLYSSPAWGSTPVWGPVLNPHTSPSKPMAPPADTRTHRGEIPDDQRRRTWAIVALGVLALGIGAILAILSARGEIGEANPAAAELVTPRDRGTPPSAIPEQKPPEPSPPEDPAERKAAIFPFVIEWANSIRELDLDRHIRTYAPVVEVFFTKRGVPQSEIRAEKQKLFNGISDVRRFGVRDIRIESFQPDRAVVNFRKSWDLQGAAGGSGTDRERFTLQWLEGGWRITSEQEVVASRARRSRARRRD